MRASQERCGQCACPQRGYWRACMYTHSWTLSSMHGCFLFFFLLALQGALSYLSQHMLVIPTLVKLSVRSPGLHGEYQTSQAYKGRPLLYPVFQWNKTKNKAQNDAYWLRGQRKAPAAKSVDLSSIPGHHRVKEDNGPLPLLPSDLHTNDVACTCYIHTYICTSVCNQSE